MITRPLAFLSPGLTVWLSPITQPTFFLTPSDAFPYTILRLTQNDIKFSDLRTSQFIKVGHLVICSSIPCLCGLYISLCETLLTWFAYCPGVYPSSTVNVLKRGGICAYRAAAWTSSNGWSVRRSSTRAWIRQLPIHLSTTCFVYGVINHSDRFAPLTCPTRPAPTPSPR